MARRGGPKGVKDRRVDVLREGKERRREGDKVERETGDEGQGEENDDDGGDEDK